MYISNSPSCSALSLNFPSALIGIGIFNLHFTDMFSIDFSVDYYFLSFFSELLDASFGAELAADLTVFQSDKLKIKLKVGVDSLFLLEQSMLEINSSAKIGIGISYNE